MIGLIKKDLLMIKDNLKTMAIILVVFAFMAINGNGNFSFIPAFISVMAMMTTFSYDEYNHSDSYISTFPNGRRNAVRAKYLSTFLVIVISLTLTFLLSVVVGMIQDHIDMEEILSTTFGCGVSVLLLQSVLYPLIYKFGIEKSRIGIFVGIFGISGIVSFFIQSGVSVHIPKSILMFFDHFWMFLVPLIVLFVLFISYKIAEQVYIKKEF